MPADPRTWSLGTASSLFRRPSTTEWTACRQAGITHLELDLFGHGIDATSPEGRGAHTALVRQAQEAGLTLWSVHLPFGGRWDISATDPAARAWAVQQNGELLQQAAAWGAGRAVIHGSAEPISPEARPERLRTSLASLATLAECAARAGIQLAVECLPRTCLGNAAAEMHSLLAAAEGLAVCCDVNHLFVEPPAAFIDALGPEVATLHISDNDAVDERHWLPGRGVIDWTAVLGALARAEYPGPFLFEVGGVAPADLTGAWQRLLEAFGTA